MQHKKAFVLMFLVGFVLFVSVALAGETSTEDYIYEVKEDCGANITGGKCRDACVDLLWSGASISATSDETNKCIEAFCVRSTDTSEKYCTKFCEKIGDAHPRCVEDYLNKYCQGNNAQAVKCERYCIKINNKHVLCGANKQSAESKASNTTNTKPADSVKKAVSDEVKKVEDEKGESASDGEKKEESKLEKALPTDKEIFEKIKSFFQNWKWTFWKKESSEQTSQNWQEGRLLV